MTTKIVSVNVILYCRILYKLIYSIAINLFINSLTLSVDANVIADNTDKLTLRYILRYGFGYVKLKPHYIDRYSKALVKVFEVIRCARL